jgi:tetratricopeptide (TPR) repeat protein
MRGIKALDDGDFEVVVGELEQAVALGVAKHDLAELYTILGRAYKDLNQLENAIAAHTKALEINPNHYKAWNNLGVAYFYLGHLDEAEKNHEKAISIEPTYAFAHASLGAVYIQKNTPRKAIRALRRAIAINPQISVAHANIALALAVVGRFQEAQASLKQATVLGYENWRTIQERINSLKALEQMNLTAATVWEEVGRWGKATDRAVDFRSVWLPSRCPACGAPISVSTVRWSNVSMPECPYCGMSLQRPLDD